ncbi:hypothetical protein [Sphingomonas bacterium]|uniref:hypothetical protein n=1 Tax=Sphingomonas bacterium TaxID=1895847 RepID=UPI001575C400|nr:hypothetical protein [Sphingomonas bacterium]
MPTDKTTAIPPDNGTRASVDPRTGEVRGSGVGAGGGSSGEDPSSDSAAGDGQPANGIDAEKTAE